MKQGVIFDLDGVVINSHNVQAQALKQVCLLLGIPPEKIPYQDFFDQSGNSLENIFQMLHFPLGLTGIYRQYSRQHIKDIPLCPGMKELLENTKAAGVSCAICTGKDRQRTLEILEHHGLSHMFQAVVGSDEVSSPKPDPQSVLLACERLGVADAVMVGDGVNDIYAAHSAGFKAIAVTWGDTAQHNLRAANPEWMVHYPEDLGRILNRYATKTV